MGNTYFFTGFPGFIASNLISEIIKKQEVEKFYLLILEETKTAANKSIDTICNNLAVSRDKFDLVIGDITQPNIGINTKDADKILSEVTHAYHLAAIYDLSVKKNTAEKINIAGTRNVNEWLLKANNLDRYTYFSTAYVSGKRTGTIYETDLSHNQGFKNYYESTKYEAELLVDKLKESIPVTIIRPGIVIGHSETGETMKFDGPYFILNLLERLKFMPSLPYFGQGRVEVNFIPIDYVVRSTIYLSHANQGEGKTYHLTDPHPYLAREVYRMLMEILLGQTPSYTMPLSAAKLSLNIPSIRKWLHVQKQTLEYFTCDSHYDASIAQKDLEGSGIVCPDLEHILPSIVNFYVHHKDDQAYQIKIS